MMKRTKQFEMDAKACCLLIVLICLLTGCSVTGRDLPAHDPIEVEGGEVGQPFTLKLLDEFNDGNALHIAGTVTAHTRWLASAAKIKMTGLSSGDQQQVKEVTLAQALPKARKQQFIEQGDTVPFSLTLPSDSMTDYTIELLWSDKPFPQVVEKIALPSQDLTVNGVTLEKDEGWCGAAECTPQYKILATLINNSAAALSEITLGVGLVASSGAGVDLSHAIPENEQKIDLAGVVLKPGESRRLKLSLDQTLPSEKYRASVRVLSATH